MSRTAMWIPESKLECLRTELDLALLNGQETIARWRTLLGGLRGVLDAWIAEKKDIWSETLREAG